MELGFRPTNAPLETIDLGFRPSTCSIRDDGIRVSSIHCWVRDDETKVSFIYHWIRDDELGFQLGFHPVQVLGLGAHKWNKLSCEGLLQIQGSCIEFECVVVVGFNKTLWRWWSSNPQWRRASESVDDSACLRCFWSRWGDKSFFSTTLQQLALYKSRKSYSPLLLRTNV